MSTKAISALAVAASLLGTVGAAQADAKNYPGSRCLVWSGGEASFGSSRIINKTSSLMKVDCPAVRDGGTNVSGWVRGIDARQGDNNSPNALKCSLVSAYVSTDNDLIYSWSNTQQIYNWPAINQQMTFSAIPTDSLGWQYYSCEIPAVDVTYGESSIAVYQVNEG